MIAVSLRGSPTPRACADQIPGMNFGIMWVYIGFNIFAAIGLYYLARVPKGAKAQEVSTPTPEAPAETLEKSA